MILSDEDDEIGKRNHVADGGTLKEEEKI